ncbi:MAG: FAD-dependent oxidoreductase, partial [Sedimentisphaerales bacterium]|nr:FAD-dependent oxidoreductase [Sedimentisphaerales bacterium]
LAFGLPAAFSANVMRDILNKLLKRNVEQSGDETFASILESGLGPTICREFYFPYTRKIWGLLPEELSPIQAYRRVSSNTLNKMFLKIVSAVPGFKTSGSGRFFYPTKGFGQIGESFYREAVKTGVEFHLGSSVKSLTHNGITIDSVCCQNNEKTVTYQADYVWSTIPVTGLVQSLKPHAPASVLDASRAIQYRQMILIYLVLEQQQFTEYDAHYFPETDIPITRLSEPKHYNNAKEPQNRTLLCAELPCSAADPEWSMTDEELTKLMLHCLESAGIPVQVPVLTAVTRRLSHAYPIYLRGYDVYFNEIDNWLSGLKNLLTFGRQGLFVHDNTHHALYMGYAAAKCFNGSDGFDRTQWQEYRKIFNTHVVED